MGDAIYTAEDISKFFIDIANHQYIADEGLAEGITNLKLQKILYFAQAAHLAVYGKPLFNDQIEAWKFGPVIKNVYEKYKSNNSSPIPTPDQIPDLSNDLIEFLKSVWDIYGKFSAYELVNITHSHEPWKETYYGGSGNIITQEMLMKYYRNHFISEDDNS